MSLNRIWNAMKTIAPLKLAEKWDNVGVLISPIKEKRENGKVKILLCNDIVDSVIDEAIQNNIGAIISYHPIIFRGIKRMVPEDRVSRIVMQCIKNDIAVYSPHTACDAVLDGVNDWIVEGIGSIKKSTPITPNNEDPRMGIGRIACLEEPYPTLEMIIDRLKKHFKIAHLQLATNQPLMTYIKTVAVCAGSGDSVLTGVEADLYVTGEMSHHPILDSIAANRSVICCNHSNTERGYLEIIKQKLLELLGEDTEILISQVDKDPLSVF